MTAFTHTDDYGDSLTVENDGQGAAAVTTDHCNSVLVSREEAPAVALAILDAVGYVPRFPGNGQIAEGKLYAAAALLQEGVLEEAEAELDPSLETEALALLNTATDSCYASFPNETIQDVWLRVARAARQIHS
ncbi:hypothetical protein SEA_NITRO_56 [Arthrobacter phage Nitro]|uniref:Uncharacterized protein n=1 Tax=Arthrobacter phage Nitro TaxID=3077792 RepID=A0AA96HDS9_9CAUD|nr:hypothetical protein SEA_NITRO_56 [Arthrobacter phage Nitro]